jgi:hypothetical protein
MYAFLGPWTHVLCTVEWRCLHECLHELMVSNLCTLEWEGLCLCLHCHLDSYSLYCAVECQGFHVWKRRGECPLYMRTKTRILCTVEWRGLHAYMLTPAHGLIFCILLCGEALVYAYMGTWLVFCVCRMTGLLLCFHRYLDSYDEDYEYAYPGPWILILCTIELRGLHVGLHWPMY